MAFFVSEMFTQSFMQGILPAVSSPLFWTIIFVLTILGALRYILFPCITLHGLEQAVAEVDQLFKGYQMDSVLHPQMPPSHNISPERTMEYEEELLR